MNDLPTMDQNDVSIADQTAGNHELIRLLVPQALQGMCYKVQKTVFLPDGKLDPAEVSVIPLTTASKHLPTAFLQFFVTNGTVISTYDQLLVTLDLGLHRVFKWPFIIAAVSQPIIGADFLRHYGLLVDIRHGHLLDSLTKLQTHGMVQQGNNFEIQTVNGNIKFHRLLAEFPSIVEAVSTSRKLKHNNNKRTFGFPQATTTSGQVKGNKAGVSVSCGHRNLWILKQLLGISTSLGS
ncbi:peptidase A2 domain-containing protein [Trichonephila clavipes]|nr:peptidase A2 domain-containing protein [Trichonephila clavipes]